MVDNYERVGNFPVTKGLDLEWNDKQSFSGIYTIAIEWMDLLLSSREKRGEKSQFISINPKHNSISGNGRRCCSLGIIVRLISFCLIIHGSEWKKGVWIKHQIPIFRWLNFSHCLRMREKKNLGIPIDTVVHSTHESEINVVK